MISCNIYNPDDGLLVKSIPDKEITKLYDVVSAHKYGEECAVKWSNVNKIDAWSIDNNSELWKSAIKDSALDNFCTYFSRSDVQKLSEWLGNDTLKNICGKEGLIVDFAG